MDVAKHRKVLKYYERFSATAALAFAWGSMRAASKVEKVGWLNRQKDYMALRGDDKRLALHHKLHSLLADAAAQWDSYDYGEGYFYQGYAAIGITGLRSTEERVQAMGLNEIVAGKTVFEIGCNTGFLSLSIADAAAEVTGFDINSHLIAVAEAVAEYQGASHVNFASSRFEDWSDAARYDVVLSFANHSTYDENTSQGIDEYFDRCAAHTNDGGLLVFESHPPAHEGDGLDGVCRSIEQHFKIETRRVLEYGSFLDNGRTFIVARRL